MLRQRNLDDMRFDELSDAARMRISEYLPAWSDINTHDPGITLLELFAWLTEQQRFYMDQIEEAYPFFPLLGIKLKDASAAAASIDIAGGFAPRVIAAGTALYAEDVRFETERDIHYDGSPKTVRVIQRETVSTPIVLGQAGGYPRESFTADIRGQIILDFSLSVNDGEWEMAEDLRASRPEDKHYKLNRETGEITFGDGMRGALPYGEVVITMLSLTRGPDGNIAPNRLHELDGLPITQAAAAKGGSKRETVPHALRRFKADREQAATAQGIERIVQNTPGLDIMSVRAFAQEEAPKLGKPRIINVAVKLKDGCLSEASKRIIRERLEPYRIVCRDFVILQAKTARITLALEIRAMPHGARFKAELETAIRIFFDESFHTLGALLRISELRSFVSDVPEVSDITRCAFRVYGGAKISSEGDVALEPDVIAELSEISIRIIT